VFDMNKHGDLDVAILSALLKGIFSVDNNFCDVISFQ